jgi:hypothetical protein
MLEFKRGDTWDITCNIKLNGVKQDLRGATVYITIKKELTTPEADPEDEAAAYKNDYLIPNGPDAITEWPIVVTHQTTADLLGKYYLSIQYKMASGAVYEPFTEEIRVSKDGTNRTA